MPTFSLHFTILIWNLEERWGGIDWIYLTQDKNQRRALVNIVMSLRVPSNAGKFLSR
jgi:hypothetical protein